MDYTRALATLEKLKYKISQSVSGRAPPQGHDSERASINNELCALNVAMLCVGNTINQGITQSTVQGEVWDTFAAAVGVHVKTYAVPQYGDTDDEVSLWTPEEIATQIRKYSARVGKNVRPGQELLDCLKMAHLASRLFVRLSGDDPTITKGTDDVRDV